MKHYQMKNESRAGNTSGGGSSGKKVSGTTGRPSYDGNVHSRDMRKTKFGSTKTC